MSKVLKTCYGWLAILAIVLGLVLGVIFVLAIAIGGPAAVTLSGFAAAFMPWCIGVAALATLIGLIQIYTSREHTLTVSSGTTSGNDQPETDPPAPYTPDPAP